MFTIDNFLSAGKTFLFLFGELLILFIVISFIVALLQVYISKDRIKKVLTTPRRWLNSVLGALFGAVTPFCSCSTIPILTGLLKSRAPFSGVMSFLFTSPILNPAIIALFLTFFGIQATVVYTLFTFLFAVVIGILLDMLGFRREVKDLVLTDDMESSCCDSTDSKESCCDSSIAVDSCCCDADTVEITYETLQGGFLQKNIIAWKYSAKEALSLFRGVLLYLFIGSGIGAFIYEFIPTELLASFAGVNNIWAIPVAAILGIPMLFHF